MTIEESDKHVKDAIAKINSIGNEIVLDLITPDRKMTGRSIVRTRCNKCGYICNKRIMNSLDPRHVCMNCCYLRKIAKAKQLLQNKIDALYGNNVFKVSGEYIHNRKPVEITCCNCGANFMAIPHQLLRKANHTYSCPNKLCKNSNAGKRRISIEEVSNRISDLYNGEYAYYSGNYITESKTNIKIKHIVCGTIFTTSLGAFCNQDGTSTKIKCPVCWRKHNLLKEAKVQEKALQKYFPEYSVEYGTYKGTNEACTLIDNNKNTEFKARVGYLLYAARNFGKLYHKGSSYSEKYIAKLLSKSGVKYERQKSFDGLRYKSKLLFDFYLPDSNLAIEFDGEFHYVELVGKEAFCVSKKRDNIKNQYCLDHDIKLIRIPFWERKKLNKIVSEIIKDRFESQNEIISKLNFKPNPLDGSTTIENYKNWYKTVRVASRVETSVLKKETANNY